MLTPFISPFNASVFTVATRKTNVPRGVSGAGTAFQVKPGLLLAARHVVCGSNIMDVAIMNASYNTRFARVVAEDEHTDLALLSWEVNGEEIYPPVLPLSGGDSLRIKQGAFFLGYPAEEARNLAIGSGFVEGFILSEDVNAMVDATRPDFKLMEHELIGQVKLSNVNLSQGWSGAPVFQQDLVVSIILGGSPSRAQGHGASPDNIREFVSSHS